MRDKTAEYYSRQQREAGYPDHDEGKSDSNGLLSDDMKIEFFFKDSGEVIEQPDGWLFLMENEVWCDTFETCESQAAVVGFDDFVKQRPDIGWRAVT